MEPADRTGIPGRIDHMRYDPLTGRLFIACVANGSLEVIDLLLRGTSRNSSGLRGPQESASLAILSTSRPATTESCIGWTPARWRPGNRSLSAMTLIMSGSPPTAKSG